MRDEQQMSWFDTNGDGVGDIYGTDANGDGFLEEVYTDTNGDGVADYMAADSNSDGHAEQTFIDGNADGVADFVAVDANSDGWAETMSFDTNYDGVSDTVYSDLDGNGSMEHTAVDTNADGVLDSFVLKLDRDQDGVFDTTITQSSEGTITTDSSVGIIGPTLDGYGPSSVPSDGSTGNGLDEPSGPYSSRTHDNDSDGVPDYFDRNPRRDEEGYFRRDS